MFFNKTVDNVVKSLQEIIDDLDDVYEDNGDIINTNNVRIDRLEAANRIAGDERTRAQKIKAKLEALLS